MKKQFAALLAALSLLPTLALAQEYYTLPEIREQAKDGWHETYTDRYGRETVVDIDVEVYGEETAPVLKVGWGKYGKFTDDNAFKLEENHPVNRLMEAKKRGGKSTYIYEWVKNMKVNFGKRFALILHWLGSVIALAALRHLIRSGDRTPLPIRTRSASGGETG